jgi:hypothetical protein
MSAKNTTTATTRAVTQHDCAEHGCQAAMLGLDLGDATPANAEEGFTSGW